jgi:hypothetical protein
MRWAWSAGANLARRLVLAAKFGGLRIGADNIEGRTPGRGDDSFGD